MKKKRIWLFYVALALCVTLHAGAGAAASESLPVNNWLELKATLTGGHNNDVVELKKDIKASDVADMDLYLGAIGGHIKTPILVDKGNCTLHLNGFRVIAELDAAEDAITALIGVQSGAQLSIIGPGQLIDARGRGIVIASDGEVDIRDVKMVGGNVLYNAPQGRLTVTSGEFRGHREALASRGHGDILGGTFSAETSPALVIANHRMFLQGGRFETKSQCPAIMSHVEPLYTLLAPGYAYYGDGQLMHLQKDQKALKGVICVRPAHETPAPCPEPCPEVFLTSQFSIDELNVTTRDRAGEHVQTMDVAPYIKNNRTMLPMRFVGQSLGATVDFDPKSRNIHLFFAGRNVLFHLDSHIAYVNGVSHPMENRPEIVNGRSMLPIGEIADLLGLSRAEAISPTGNLLWDGEKRTVTMVVPYCLFDESSGPCS